MGRPRSDHVPTDPGVCDKHGETVFRIHRIGRRRNGAQKYRRRCPECHAESNRVHSVKEQPDERPPDEG